MASAKVRWWVAVGAVVAASTAVLSPVAAADDGPGAPDAAVAPAARAGGDGHGKGDGSNLSQRLQVLAIDGAGRRSTVDQNEAVGLPSSGPGSLLRGPKGSVVVEVRLDTVDPSVFAAIEAVGATVTARADAEHLASLNVPVSQLRALAAVPGVAFVQETLTPKVGGEGVAGGGAEASERPAGAGTRGLCADRLISEGDNQLRAATARSTYAVDGAGVTVGILSDSYSRFGGATDDIADGELPGPGNPCGRTSPVQIQKEYNGPDGSIDEGRAMAQIVHDLAPGATMRFATAYVSELDFAAQIRALATAGAGVIVDDIYYYEEPIYQDGPIARAVADVSANGVAYFAAGGNDNIRIGGRDVGSYETPAMRRVTCPTLRESGSAISFPQPVSCHDFNPGAPVDTDDQITVTPGGEVIVKLGWSEPTNGVTTDLDLFLVDGSGNVVASAWENNITGTKKPTELLWYRNGGTSSRQLRLVVLRYGPGASSPRFKFIKMAREGAVTAVEYNQSGSGDLVGPSNFGHSASGVGANVAAIPYSNANAVENFSSRGPGRVCWGPVVGTTAASALPGGCEERPLTVAATDGTRNSFFGSEAIGFYRFFGTSAAAPHAAAVAALQRQAQPCRTGAQLIAAQQDSAGTVGSLGPREVGAGIVRADGAIAVMDPCLGPPSAPPGAYAVAGVSDAVVRWSPAAPNGAAITSYTVTPYVGGVAGTPRTFAAGATSGTVTGLTAGTSYTFRVHATNSYGAGARSADTNAVTPGTLNDGTVYVPITPCRVLDTRKAAAGTFGKAETRAIQVAGTGITGQGGRSSCIPDGAAAAELSISALGATGSGYLRAWPNGQEMPLATFLNYSNASGTTNTGAVPLAASGRQDLALRNLGVARGYVVDVQGYYVRPEVAPAGSVYVPITPCRVLDTRRAGGAMAPGSVRHLQVAGTGITGQGARSSCIPDGVTAVEASISAVSPSVNGFLRAWPRGQAQPTATFVNYSDRKGTTNTGAVTLAPTGRTDLSIGNNLGTSHVVIDIQGYFVPASQVPVGAVGSRYVPITPCRMLDTRRTGGTLTAGAVTSYQLGGGIVTDQGAMAGCIPDGSTAAEVSVSAVAPAGSGYTRAWPANVGQPSATFLNFVKGEATTNTGSVALAPTGALDLGFGNFGGTSNYVIDVQGYFVASP